MMRSSQAPYDEEGKQILLNKEMIAISQLSLVDLAGSERASKTNVSITSYTLSWPVAAVFMEGARLLRWWLIEFVVYMVFPGYWN